MERRKFIERILIGGSSVLAAPRLLAQDQLNENPTYQYGKPGKLEDLISKEGQVMIRLELKARESLEPIDIDVSVACSQGRINRIKHCFFEPDHQLLDKRSGRVRAKVNRVDPAIMVAWIDEPLNETRIRISLNGQHTDLTLSELIPIHPIGIDPLINYAESVKVKRLISGILSRHGKVKYIFSGHVHIPIRASFKTAVNYKGMKMINLPAAGCRKI